MTEQESHGGPGGQGAGGADPGKSGPGAGGTGEGGAEAGDAADGGSASEAGGTAGGGSQGRRPGWTGPISDIQGAVSDIVDTALRGLGGAVGSGRFPRFDMVQVPGEGYRVYVDLPAVAREELDVSTVGDELTVSGTRRRPDLPEGSEVLRSEREYGRFRRSLRIPADVDAGAIKARLEEGVLVLTLPRRDGSPKHRVEVES